MEGERQLALFEDNRNTIRSLEDILANKGYKITVVATNVTQSLELIPRLKDMGVRVALVDGNLTKGKHENSDGMQITEEIHQRSPGVVVIGIATSGLVKGAEYNVSKTESPRVLFDVLTKAFE